MDIIFRYIEGISSACFIYFTSHSDYTSSLYYIINSFTSTILCSQWFQLIWPRAILIFGVIVFQMIWEIFHHWMILDCRDEFAIFMTNNHYKELWWASTSQSSIPPVSAHHSSHSSLGLVFWWYWVAFARYELPWQFFVQY
jgi:hypothetical protein